MTRVLRGMQELKEISSKLACDGHPGHKVIRNFLKIYFNIIYNLHIYENTKINHSLSRNLFCMFKLKQ